MEKNLAAIYTETQQKLSTIHGDREAQLITDMLFQDLLGISKTDRILNPNRSIDPEILEGAINRLMQHEPIQHILGEAHFFGHVFKVNEHTLIPRPETEELVDLILRENKQPHLKVLDIGTGTGCIAISLALALKDSEVTAWDISEDALNVAQENADKLEADVRFEKVDVLREEIDEKFDIIVSNPPYIPQHEKSEMKKNVVNYDPELALFVPNEDPLIFYRSIGKMSLKSLRSEGRLYFEIHEAFGIETVRLLEGMGYIDVNLLKDLQRKDRMIRGVNNQVSKTK